MGPSSRLSPARRQVEGSAGDVELMAVDAELARKSWQLGQGGSQLEDATHTRRGIGAWVRARDPHGLGRPSCEDACRLALCTARIIAYLAARSPASTAQRHPSLRCHRPAPRSKRLCSATASLNDRNLGLTLADDRRHHDRHCLLFRIWPAHGKRHNLSTHTSGIGSVAAGIMALPAGCRPTG